MAHMKRLFTECLPLFSALGDATRQRLILLMFDDTPKTVQQLSDSLQLSRPAVSHHLKVLKNAGLLEETRRGARRYYHPVISRQADPLKELIKIVDQLDQQEKECSDHGKRVA